MKNIFSKLKDPKILKRLGIGLAIIFLIAGAFYLEKTHDRVAIDDSLAQAPISSITPANNGTLSQMDVYEGEHIKKGDQLAVIGGQTVFSDTDGIVIMADNQLGSSVTSQNPVVQVINPVDMRIAGTIDENKGLDQVTVGQVASFTVDALPNQTFWGYVDEVSPSAKQTQLSFSISSERPTQQFVVYVRFDATKYPAIKNGMSAKLTVYTSKN